MEIPIIVAIIGLSLASFAYADTWENNTITVSITDNEWVTQERLDHIQYTISAMKTKNDSYAGWNNALNTINGTGIQFKLVEEKGDVQITLVNYKSTNMYSAFTTFESSSPGILSKANITIYEIEEISNHELQMLMRHELGHALGLGHSKESTNLMYPIIPYYTSYISQNNINSIASLY